MAAERSIEVPAQAEHLQALRELAGRAAREHGFADVCVRDLVLAVNEACMNVIQHGYAGRIGTIALEVRPLHGGIEFRIRDHAVPVTLESWQARDLDDIRPGGLGVHFIREIMDDVCYLPPPDHEGNLLSLKKYLASEDVAHDR